MSTIIDLHKTLKQRKRPEDVAQMVLEVLEGGLNSNELMLLKKAAKGSLKQMFWGYTSMMQEFATARGAEKQIKKAIEIFELDTNASVDGDNISEIQLFIEKVAALIHKKMGANNFLADRLNKEQRASIGLELSKRNYNKKWRLLKRLEAKLLKYSVELKKIEFQKIGKHGLSHRLDLAEFEKDLHSACFIAYYNARCNLRSKFTNTSQERAFDEISDMLFKRSKGMVTSTHFRIFKTKQLSNVLSGATPNWWAIAHIYTSQEVLSNLSDEQKGRLLGQWTSVLEEIACFLSELWSKSDINRQTMVVKMGNDSTTWNNTAAAWNKARDNWMNIIYALGMEYLLDDICFGKVLRLMAADVVAWHAISGGSIDPNTDVWNKIPLPWEVFQGKENCTKQLVVKYCTEVGLDPEKSGWIAPRVHKVVAFTPTPELVHGVSVSNPYLATVLRKHKYFSGKNAHPLNPERN